MDDPYKRIFGISGDNELLCCPFCGTIPEIEPWHGGGARKRLISCVNEDCTVGPFVTGTTKARAIAHWNRRAT